MDQNFELVILESPFKAKVPDAITVASERDAYAAIELERNIKYARAAMRDSLKNHGELPSASHLLFTQEGVLDDNNPEERTLGIYAGLAWRAPTKKSVVYIDRGISSGMILGVKAARKTARRSLPGACRRRSSRPSVFRRSMSIPRFSSNSASSIRSRSIRPHKPRPHKKRYRPEPQARAVPAGCGNQNLKRTAASLNAAVLVLQPQPQGAVQ